MKIEVFEYLLAIEKYGSLNQAAEHLYVSQPNLTNVIRSLEQELGYAVLTRGHRGVQFTEQGRQVLLSAHNIMRERDRLMTIGTAHQPLHIRISIGHYGSILDVLCKDIAQLDTMEDLDVTIQNLPVMQAMEAVYRQTLDLAYMIIPVTIDPVIRDYAEGHGLLARFFKESICEITLREGHPLLQDGFSMEGLWNYPFVDFTDQYPDAYGVCQPYINPHKKILVDHASLRGQIIRQTDAYAIGLHHNGAQEEGLVTIPTPNLYMHLVELRRETDRNNRLYNSLRDRIAVDN